MAFKMNLVQHIVILLQSFSLLDYLFNFNIFGNHVPIFYLQSKELSFHNR
jgi:hypothetical protein